MNKAEAKRQILAILFEKMIKQGYAITDYVGRPLNYFNYEKCMDQVHELEYEEYQETLYAGDLIDMDVFEGQYKTNFDQHKLVLNK